MREVSFKKSAPSINSYPKSKAGRRLYHGEIGIFIVSVFLKSKQKNIAL